MSLLFLIGMPGAGKTHWAKKLAAHHHLPCFDTDEMIEEAEGLTIQQVFEAKGETYFRQRETELLLQLIDKNKDAIIACGGGTPTWNNNLEMMKSAGCTVYLQAGIEWLLHNISKDETVRPLLRQSQPAEVLSNLLEARKKVYKLADYILQAESLSIANFDKIINQCINRH